MLFDSSSDLLDENTLPISDASIPYLSTGKWHTSLEQPHDETHLAIGGQDHLSVKAQMPKAYDKNENQSKAKQHIPVQVSLSLPLKYHDRKADFFFDDNLLAHFSRRSWERQSYNK